MDCTSCKMKIEGSLERLKGVTEASVTVATGHSHNDLNVRGVLLHGVADAASSGGVILAACAVYFFNWLWADAAGSLIVAVLIGYRGSAFHPAIRTGFDGGYQPAGLF